jgi:4-amino-4-deoxychorismate lyase
VKNSFLETIKSVDGKLFHMSYHQKRYESVLNSLAEKDVKNLEDYIDAPKIGIFKCRLVYNQYDISVSYHEYKKRDISSLKLIFNNEIDYSMKSTFREELDNLYSQRGECDDILIIKELLVTDTSIANIAFYNHGMWITPKNPLLKGTTRARLLDEGKLVEADIKVQELRSFSKVALLNAMTDFDVLDKCEFLI